MQAAQDEQTNQSRERANSEPAAVEVEVPVESTSDDTQSAGASSSNEEELLIAEMCRPITSMLTSLGKQTTRKFLFDACAGLSGSETLHQFACIYDEVTRRFYVWLGDLDFALFTKSTFMNLSNFAEKELGARTAVFLVYHQHRQKAQYRSMFKVIDAQRLRSETVKEMVGGDKQAAKAVLANTLFYELAL